MNKLLVISPGQEVMEDCVFCLLDPDTGEVLASHLCSNSSFAFGDLYKNRPKRIEEWTKRFGELEVKYIDQTTISEEELIEKNKKWYEENRGKGEK